MQITYREYWKEVKALAKQIAEESLETGNDAQDILAETVDGHEYVIYYAKQLDVLQHTDNEDALFDIDGTLEADSFTDATTKLAYWAFYQDVQDYLQEDKLKLFL